MTPADLARKNAIPMEVKKDGLQQRQNGDWMLRFVLQGSDMDARLLNAPMGARFQAVLVEIDENELPVQKEAPAKPDQVSPPDSRPDRASRQKMDWRQVQPAAQAALRCDQPAFHAFLREQHNYSDVRDADSAANAIRHMCVVKSRSEFSTDHRKRVLWKMLDDQFQAWKAVEHA